MRRALPWTAAVLLAAANVLLLFNVRERDAYDGGRLLPPEGAEGPENDSAFARLLPDRIVHPCPRCGECAHPLEIVENRRTLTLEDRDGWYRLFWAGSETYHYGDPVFLAAGLRNRTAGEPRGSWRLRARPGPPVRGPAPGHACGEIPSLVELRYALFTSETPIDEIYVSPAPHLRVARAIQALAYRYEVPHRPPVLYFGWRLAEDPRVETARCLCGPS
ncbi:MAG TPA: hypothetical protein VNO22_14865 [Planctomycetota bacterium]|nr:hypothetical protein [Planctomycetota bacterium]